MSFVKRIGPRNGAETNVLRIDNVDTGLLTPLARRSFRIPSTIIAFVASNRPNGMQEQIFFISLTIFLGNSAS